MYSNRLFRKILRHSPLKFKIIDLDIHIKTQLDFLKQIQQIRKPITENYFIRRWNDLLNNEIPLDVKKQLLVEFSFLGTIKVMHRLDRFALKCPSNLKDFAKMAAYQCKIFLEASILEEPKILLASGLGGKDGKLRLFVVFIAKNNVPLSEIQQEIIKKELDYNLEIYDAQLEKLSFDSLYAKIFCLVPLEINLPQFIRNCISGCNELGDFLDKTIIATADREISSKDIEIILSKRKKKSEVQ
ncbi:MAG: hypothetical protein ACRCSB_03610 [Bacteroidales bacterium]